MAVKAVPRLDLLLPQAFRSPKRGCRGPLVIGNRRDQPQATTWNRGRGRSRQGSLRYSSPRNHNLVLGSGGGACRASLDSHSDAKPKPDNPEAKA